MLTRLSRGFLVAALLAVLLSGLTGCSSGDEDAARTAAERVARGLASYDVASVRQALTTPEDAAGLDDLMAPLDKLTSKVAVTDVVTDGDEATATLRWDTQAAGGHWTRTTKAHLVRRGDRWLVEADPALVSRKLKDGDTLRVSTVQAERGRILGQGGTPLVRPRPVLRIGLDKTQVPPGRARLSARELARALHIDGARFAKEVVAAGPKAFVEALVVRRQGLPPDYLLAFEGIVGARAISDHLPLGPSRGFAAQIIGTVGPATAELIKASKGRLEPGDQTGRSGLQLRYDEQLAGTDGIRISIVRGDEQANTDFIAAVPELFSVEPVAGKDLQTSFDQALQQRADDLLAATGSDSGLVAIRPSTGEIVAAASGAADNGYNTATFGRYAPGSTFKVVSALALVRAGVTPASTVECAPAVTVNGKRFENYDDYPPSGLGRIRFEDAFANSCNTAFISQRDKLRGGDLTRAAASLGLGVDHDLGFPAYFGQVPPPEGETEAAADMIGQGKVLASPMAMAAVLASVMRGRTVVPHLLADHQPTAGPEQPLTAREAEVLRQLLRAVVVRGSGTALQSLGPDTLAKTGTAEFGEPARDGSLKTHAWMLGGVDDLAVAVFVDEGSSGSGTAGPILKSFLESTLRR
jgi:cell division protein FtsI/penicillin-binding protein 2